MRFFGTALMGVFGLLGGTSLASASVVYAITSGATQIATPVIPFTTAQTGAQFYNYSGSEANPPFTLTPNRLHVYLHQNTATLDLSLGFIFNTNDNSLGISAGSFTGQITGALSTASPGVEDDFIESFGWQASDPFDGAATVNGQYDFFWGPGFTDGFTIETTADTPWAITLEASRLTGIDDVAFLYGDPSAPSLLALESPLASPLTVSVHPVPLPASAAFLLLGCGLLISLRRGGLSAKGAPQPA